ncbi:CPBP family intramembrane glutamic endopeptidase [Enterococcus sp. DIV0187]|uniref:CPBP family intramembrane glutamic endopeptidase n=1 Tax=Enterococcus sp. DIV0187 TaxID=2774644 RepID=UPI003F21E090
MSKLEQAQFNLLQIILLHLLPGLPILFLVTYLANPNWGAGLPMITALYIGITFGVIPIQLLIIFYFAKRERRKLSEVISFTKQDPVLSTIFWIILLFIWSGIMFTLISEAEQSILGFYKYIPNWFQSNYESVQHSSKTIIVLTAIMGPLINGLLGPITEEVYFRGFLLPRMKGLGKAAPMVNTLLFSLYHFFSPWQNFTRILALFPYVYVVWKKENIRIGIYVHCLTNLMGSVAGAILLLG